MSFKFLKNHIFNKFILPFQMLLFSNIFFIPDFDPLVSINMSYIFWLTFISEIENISETNTIDLLFSLLTFTDLQNKNRY
jgi:hypothetical protein